MEALVCKRGSILGYSIRKDVIYLSFSVPSDSFQGLYCNLVAFRFPADDIKTVVSSLKDKKAFLRVYFKGAIIHNIDFDYTSEVGKEVS